MINTGGAANGTSCSPAGLLNSAIVRGSIFGRFAPFALALLITAVALAQGNPTVTSIGSVFNHDMYQNSSGGLLTEVTVPLTLADNAGTTSTVTIWLDKSDGNGPQNQGWFSITGNSGVVLLGGEGNPNNTSVWMPTTATAVGWVVQACVGRIAGSTVPTYAAITTFMIQWYCSWCESTYSFYYQIGGPLPQTVSYSLSAPTGCPACQWSYSSNQPWLLTSLSSLTGSTTATVSVNPTGLPVGVYDGTVRVFATTSGLPTAYNYQMPVALHVLNPAQFTVSTNSLSFSYVAPGNGPPSQSVLVATPGATFPFTATVLNGTSWLSVTPTSASTPASLSIAVNSANLPSGSSSGLISILSTDKMVNQLVTVDVTQPAVAPASLPTMKAVANAASYATGAVSPGELVTIFGTAIGPATAAGATIDPSTGKLATTIGGAQVLFNGIPAPMIYASSTQVSAVVPYEMAPVVSPSVWIKYAGQTSNAYQLTTAATAPGLFTQNASGSGPGSILNQDYSVNGPNNAAAKGSIVMVYLTGEGQTSPPSVTGTITTATLPPPQVTPAPVLAVGVTINGQPALYVYAGEAPGLVAGMMQLNVQIPASGASGELPILVSVGGNTSQNGVTVSVQ